MSEIKALDDKVSAVQGDIRGIKQSLETLIRIEEREKTRDKRITALEIAVDECKKSKVGFQTDQNTEDIRSLQNRLWIAVWSSLVAGAGAIFSILKGQ